MGRKRKHNSQSREPAEPPQKQQHQEPSSQEQVGEEAEKQQDNFVEEEKLGSAGEQEEAEVEEEEEEAEEEEEEDAEDEEDEPLEKLLEPFSKDQLINLLCEAAKTHGDVAERIRVEADVDPSHRKIFVHGLGWDTKAEHLVEAFKQYGEIEDCKAVCDKVSGKSKGYGFILFKNRRGARKALIEPQKKIGTRMAACQLASVGPVSAPPQQQHSGNDFTQRKIFVSNVGAELDPQKLFAYFSKFGEIEEGPLGLDKVTGKPKGFCLFVYRTADDARKALEEPHKNFDGHMLHCQKAIDGPKQGKQPQHHHHQHNVRNSHFQRNDNVGFAGAAPGHLMAPSGNGVGPAATQALDPALGHALTALLAAQGAGLGLNPALGQTLLGTLGTAGPAPGVQGVYGNHTNVNPNVMAGYATHAGYPNQQAGQAGSGRGQHGHGAQYGGVAPYMGH